MRILPVRFSLAVVLFLIVSLAADRARATPPDDDPTSLAPLAERLDVDSREAWTEGPSGSLWISIASTLAFRPHGERHAGAMLLIGVPFERVARSSGSSARSTAITEPPPLAPPKEARPDPQPGAKQSEPLAPPAPVSSPSFTIDPASTRPPARSAGEEREAASKLRSRGALLAFPGSAGEAADARSVDAEPSAASPIPIVVTPQIARAAVSAALRHARLEAPEKRLDALATRARTSALLPELRVRATRLVDEAQSLAPTEYDATRTTATGGESLWLEARATWSLDRLVFADEEIAIERLRNDRAEAQARVTTRTLELLFGWQRALAHQADPARSPEDQLEAALKVVECEAALDVHTAGWFTTWRRSQPSAPRGSP
jgi:hypothetical protein